MKTNLNQLKQEAHADRSKRVHFQTSLFLQASEQFRWFALAAFAAVFAVLFLTAFAQPASAQDVFGRISGTVTDTQGAVIPDATITITNEQTKISRSLKTDAHGFYVADDLPVTQRDPAVRMGGEIAIVGHQEQRCLLLMIEADK